MVPWFIYTLTLIYLLIQSVPNAKKSSDLEFLFHFVSGHSKAVSLIIFLSQPAITCSKLTIETLEQGVKYVQS